jgi:glycosyltransferase involved in cell wall biosynthesis
VRVLHLIETLGPGGAEHQLVSLLKAFDPRLVSSTVVTLHPPHHLESAARATGAEVMSLGAGSLRDLIPAVWRLRRWLRSTGADVLHTRLTKADLVGRLASLGMRDIRVISTIEAPVYAPEVFADSPQTSPWKVQVVRALDMVLGRLAACTYVACSHSVAESTGRALHLSRGPRVIPNSVDVRSMPAAQGAADHVTAADRVELLAVGRLSPQKGHTYLIDALPAILRQYPNARLSIAGDGPLAAQLRQQAVDRGVPHAVRFLGVRSDVPQLLAASHVCVLPSHWEGLSIVAIEALAVGVPVVATGIPSMREVFGEDGPMRYCTPADPVDLARQVLAVLADAPGRHVLHETFRARAAACFDVSEGARKYTSLYRENLRA